MANTFMVRTVRTFIDIGLSASEEKTEQRMRSSSAPPTPVHREEPQAFAREEDYVCALVERVNEKVGRSQSENDFLLVTSRTTMSRSTTASSVEGKELDLAKVHACTSFKTRSLDEESERGSRTPDSRSEASGNDSSWSEGFQHNHYALSNKSVWSDGAQNNRYDWSEYYDMGPVAKQVDEYVEPASELNSYKAYNSSKGALMKAKRAWSTTNDWSAKRDWSAKNEWSSYNDWSVEAWQGPAMRKNDWSEQPYSQCPEEVCKVVQGITTLMMYDVPFRATIERLVHVINGLGFHGTYDFVYMPASKGRSHNDSNNIGYAFVNFKEPRFATAFLEVFQNYTFPMQSPSGAKLTCTKPAHCQGYHENLQKHAKHVGSSNFLIF